MVTLRTRAEEELLVNGNKLTAEHRISVSGIQDDTVAWISQLGSQLACRASLAVVYQLRKCGECFAPARNWVKELQRQASPHIVVALSGNKADLASKRADDFQVGMRRRTQTTAYFSCRLWPRPLHECQRNLFGYR
ncbi:uncharacterized protein LOC144037588 [Vanacampus margaritifer]